MPSQINWDLEADFVAIGSGLGGMTSAIVAHDLGAKSIILEKAHKIGGVSAMSGGQIFCPDNFVMREAGIEDSYAKGREYLDWLAAGFNDPSLLDKLLEVSDEALKYLADKCGVKWMVVEDFPDYYYPVAPGSTPQGRYLETELIEGSQLGEWQSKSMFSPLMLAGITFTELSRWGGVTDMSKWDFQTVALRGAQDMRATGPGMMAYFIKAAAIDRKIPIYNETPVRQLLIQDGAVVGVRAERDGKPFLVQARKGVMIATSGYDNNEAMAKMFEDTTEWKSCIPDLCHGDNIVLGSDAGAALGKVPAGNLCAFMGAHLEGEKFEGVKLYRSHLEACLPHAIWVNNKGERFCDETFYKDFCPRVRFFDGRSNTQPNFPVYLILDSNYHEKYPMGTLPPGDPVPKGYFRRGATLRELAEKLGIDAEGLEKTVERFNKFAEQGRDEDFGRGEYPWAKAMLGGDDSLPNPQMGVLNKPPYYGLRITYVSVGINAVGLKFNADAQVLNTRDEPVKGLYVAGNAAAYLEYGAGYQSGMANMRGIAWGWVAAHHACKK